MRILVDTNVLLRRTQPDHPSHLAAVESVARFLATGDLVCFTLQNASEFWNVATRPVNNNGLGFSIATTLRELEKMERFLTLLPDSPGIYAEWKRLLVKHAITGVKVHDAKLVAAMNIHAVPKVLTFNVDDFARFQVEAIHPASLLR